MVKKEAYSSIVTEQIKKEVRLANVIFIEINGYICNLGKWISKEILGNSFYNDAV